METDTVVVRIVIDRDLPEYMRPCHVVRTKGVSVIFTYPDANEVEVLAWSIDHLRVDERNVIRAAAGQPPVGQPLTDDFVDRQFVFLPESLIVKDRSRASEVRERARRMRREALRIRSDEILRRAMHGVIFPVLTFYYDAFAFGVRTAF